MSDGPFADFQNEVYLKGLLGGMPTLLVGWRERVRCCRLATADHGGWG